MNKLFALLAFFSLLATSFVTARGAEPKSEPPPQVAALKSAGVNVSRLKEGGWNVEVKSVKDLNDDVWRQIESLPEVTRFSAGQGFTDADLARLCKVKSIRTIFFNGPAITDAGLAALNDLPELERFGVDHSSVITGAGLPALKDAKKLTALGFGGCIINDGGVADLVQLMQLKELKLGHVRITRKSFPLLAGLPNLERLEITPNWDPHYYTAADFAALAPASKLGELEVHDMVLPWDDGLEHLKALKSLKTLDLYWCYVTDADMAKLKAALPNVKIDVRNPAGPDRLKQYNEALEKLQKEAKK